MKIGFFVLLAVVVLCWALYMIGYWRSDPKRRIRLDPSEATKGSFLASRTVVTNLAKTDALRLAKKAMDAIGAHEIQVGRPPNTVVSWIGIDIRGSASEYQLLIEVDSDPPDRTLVTCSARRRRPNLPGRDRGDEYVGRMIDQMGGDGAGFEEVEYGND